VLRVGRNGDENGKRQEHLHNNPPPGRAILHLDGPSTESLRQFGDLFRCAGATSGARLDSRELRMSHRQLARRLFAAGAALAAVLAVPSAAQEAPADLTAMPPVSTDYQPKRTAWGDPDLRGTWPINDVAELPVSRPDQYGDRFWKTDEELAA